MGISFKAGNVKLNNITTYNVNTNKSDVFNNKFYDGIEDIDYSKYGDVNYNVIDLEKGIQKAEKNVEKKGIFSTIWSYTATAVGSFVSGVLDVVETVTDGIAMAGGAVVTGAVSIFNKELADEMKQGLQDYIQYDWSEAGYDASMNALGVDEDIAHGIVHKVGTMAGSVAGYAAISLIPGGAAVTMSAGALGAAGGAAEQAFNSGASFNEALAVSAVSGVAGAIAGNKVGKFGEMAKGAGSGLAKGVEGAGKELFKYSIESGAVSMLEPVANTTAQYLTYGKDIVDENGNKLYNGIGGYFDYYADSGGILNTAIAGLSGAGGAALQGVLSYKITNVDVKKSAIRKYETAKNHEPAVTSTMKNLQDNSSELIGLEHKFKSVESLSRKIKSDSLADNITIQQASDAISDSLRYTLVVDDMNYSTKVKQSLTQLENEGYKVTKFKNFWGNSEYQGINVQLETPDGFSMELQFHTDQSFNTKEILNHKFYEIARSNKSSKLEIDNAKKIMAYNQSLVNIPNDAQKLTW